MNKLITNQSTGLPAEFAAVDALENEALHDVMHGAKSVKDLLLDHPAESPIGKLVRRLLEWNSGVIGNAQRFLFRSLISFGSPSFLNDVASMIRHELLDDGALIMVVHDDGRKEFVSDSYEGTQNVEVVLDEMDRAQFADEKPGHVRNHNVMKRLAVFLETSGRPVPDVLQERIAELDRLANRC